MSLSCPLISYLIVLQPQNILLTLNNSFSNGSTNSSLTHIAHVQKLILVGGAEEG